MHSGDTSSLLRVLGSRFMARPVCGRSVIYRISDGNYLVCSGSRHLMRDGDVGIWCWIAPHVSANVREVVGVLGSFVGSTGCELS